MKNLYNVFKKVKENKDKEKVLQIINRDIDKKIQYFKNLDNDKDNMESMYKEDLKEYKEILDALYDNLDLNKVIAMFNNLDTAPRENLYYILSGMFEV